MTPRILEAVDRIVELTNALDATIAAALNDDPTIEPRRYSAFWSRAAGKNGFLVADGWTTNDDVKGGNRGKPQRMYRLRT